MRDIIFFLLFIFLVDQAYSQSLLLNGNVKSTAQVQLQSHIIVHRITDSLVISFTQTDKNGNFHINYTGSFPILISASALGYQQKYITIPDSTLLKDLVQFILEREDKVLEEVIVQSVPKIRVSGDTTSYNLSSFTTGNERALEDALAKLPGFSVGEDGRVSVNGRGIQKILIEGDDLVNKNYTLLSKNMSPEMISQVQVVDKFLNDPMLKGVEKTDDVALNLIFKKDFKKLFFGDATLEGGPDKRYNAVVNSMLLTARHKAYFLVNGNNIGKQPSFISNREVVPKTALAKDYDPMLESRGMSNINPGNVPLVEDKRSFFNNTKTGSLNLLNKITEKLNLKTNISVMSDNNQLWKRSQTTYFTGADTIRFSEKNDWQAKSVQVEGDFEAQYQFSPASRIKYNFTGSYVETPERASLLFNDDVMTQKLTTATSFYKNQVNYTYRATEKNLLTIDIVQFLNKKPQDYFVNGYDYSSIFNADGVHTLFQSSDNPVKYIGGQARYYTNYKGATVILNAGYDRYQQQLISTTSGTFNVIDNEKSYSNQLQTLKDNLYGRIDYYKKFSKNLELTSHLGIQTISMQNNYRNSTVVTPTDRSFFLAPDITFRYFLKQKSHFTLGYRYGNEFPDATRLYDSLVFSGYRTASRYQHNNRLQNEQRFSFGYRYNDSYNQFSVFINSFYATFSNSYSDSTTISNLFSLANRYIVPHGNQLTVLIFGLDKFIPPLSGTLRISGNAINNRFINNINQMDDRQIKNWTIGGRAAFITGFSGFFNFNANWQYNAIMNNVKSGESSFNNNSYSTRTFLQTDYKIAKKHYLQITSSRFQWVSEMEKQKPVIFFDGAYSGTIFKDRITLSATMQNLFNVRTLFFNQVSDYMLNVVEYNLMPRIILIGTKIRF